MNRYLLLAALISSILCEIQEINTENYLRELVGKHNAYRELHGSPFVKLDENLNEMAYNQAVRMSEEMKFSYSNSTYKGSTLGENFFYCNSFDGNSCLLNYDVPFYWYRYYYDYCFSSKSFTEDSRNFITMVWKETTTIGCGLLYKNYYDVMDTYFVVCLYYPGPHPYNGPTVEEIEANLQDRTDGNRKMDPC